ncbi:Cerevisin [Spathaspora sp. JA1]|nr:Cerevisin [Spathaspora sp. JA1]
MLVLLAVVYATLVSALVLPNAKASFNIDTSVRKVHASGGSESSVSSNSSVHVSIDVILSDPVNEIIPNHYVIVLKEGLSEKQLCEHKTWLKAKYQEMLKAAGDTTGCNVKTLEFFNIDNGLSGYSGYFSDELIEQVCKSPEVLFVERDSVFKVDEYEVQQRAPWGIARVSQRENRLYNFYSGEYHFDNNGGKGVTAYVIDTGIKVEHREFEGRAEWGAAVTYPNIQADQHGHGTHCAGIIGSRSFGIAKQVELVAVGVFNSYGTCSASDIIRGLDFVVSSHRDRSRRPGFKGSVINMSLGGGISQALDWAVNAATRSGLHIAVAAGNDNQDACYYSPARAEGPICVGATNYRDEIARFSNYGRCVDIFAPGVDIESTSASTYSNSVYRSGTSMASPHIAGLLSYFLSLQPNSGSEYFTNSIEPSTLKRLLIRYGTRGRLRSYFNGGSPNVLAYNGGGGSLSDFWNY